MILTIQSALAGHRTNNNRNGRPVANAANLGTVTSLYDAGIRTPGVVMIPVCTADIALKSWDLSGEISNYLCAD